MSHTEEQFFLSQEELLELDRVNSNLLDARRDVFNFEDNSIRVIEAKGFCWCNV